MAQAATKHKDKAEEIINSVLNKETVIDEIVTDEPESFVVRVTRLARNPRFIYAVLDGTLVEVFMPRRRDNSIGRRITVVKADELGENRYKLLP